MTPSLEGCRAKTQRAKEHFLQLYAAHQEFLNLNPYGVIVDDDPDTGKKTLRARVSREAPEEWALIIGDVIHNLRAALDYLAWQLVELGGGKTGTGIQFPVLYAMEDEAGEHEATIAGQVKGAPPLALAVIDRLQPYHVGHPGFESHPLYRLHRLDIRDKHHLLIVVGAALRNDSLHVGSGHIEQLHIGSQHIEVPLKDGAELFSLIGDVDMNSQYRFAVAFEKTGPGGGEPVVPLLDQLISFVDESLTLFAPFF